MLLKKLGLKVVFNAPYSVRVIFLNRNACKRALLTKIALFEPNLILIQAF